MRAVAGPGFRRDTASEEAGTGGQGREKGEVTFPGRLTLDRLCPQAVFMSSEIKTKPQLVFTGPTLPIIDHFIDYLKAI